MLSARSQGTPSSIPAGGSAARCSGRSPVPCHGWSGTSRDMDLNLHTTVSWRDVVCGSVLRSVYRQRRNIFKPVKYLCFVSDNSDNWTHRQQLEFAEHRDMVLRGSTYLFNKDSVARQE